MAGAAAIGGQDRVDVLALERLRLVALEARLRALGLEQKPRVRRVRVVAGGAVAVLQDLVHHRLVEADRLFLVTGEAELASALLEEQLRHDAVPEVAFLALLLLDDLVDVFLRQDLVAELLVAVEALLARE